MTGVDPGHPVPVRRLASAWLLWAALLVLLAAGVLPSIGVFGQPVPPSLPELARVAQALGQGWWPPLQTLSLVLAIALPCGLLLGLAIPATAFGAWASVALLLLVLGLSADGARDPIGWLARTLLPRPLPAATLTIAAMVWQGTALVGLLVHAGVRSIAARHWQMARFDRLTSLQRWRWLLLPRLVPALLAATLLILIRGLVDGMPAVGPWGRLAAALLLVVPATALACALDTRALLDWPAAPDALTPAPTGIAGRTGGKLLAVLLMLAMVLPLLVLAGVAAGGRTAAAAPGMPVDLLDLLWPDAWTGLHLRAALLETGRQLPWLVCCLLLAALATALAWPAAGCLMLLRADGPMPGLVRGLLLTGALLATAAVAWGPPAAVGRQAGSRWAGGDAGLAELAWALGGAAALALPGALAVALWVAERVLRRRTGRDGDPAALAARRAADEMAMLAGVTPTARVFLADGELDRGERARLFALVALLAFATLWWWGPDGPLLPAAPAAAVQAATSQAAAALAAATPDGQRAAGGLLQLLPGWLAMLVAFGLSRRGAGRIQPADRQGE